MPIPQDVRKKPTSIKVHVSTGEGVEITWADSHTSHYDFPYLRDHCPCALCNDEREKRAKGGPASAVLPMFKPRVTAKGANAVGNYAILDPVFRQSRHGNFQLRAPTRTLPVRGVWQGIPVGSEAKFNLERALIPDSSRISGAFLQFACRLVTVWSA